MKLKSAAAVAAGIGANFLAVPVDAALHAAKVFPPVGEDMSDGLFALAFAYRAAFAVLGGWVAARLAPSAPLKHAWTLAGIGLVLSSLGAATQWNLGHHWYPLALIGICIPATLTGAYPLTRSQT
jgi:hypothetical protein